MENLTPQNIGISEYDYPLPNERIAKFPLDQRDQSKLLVLRSGEMQESRFCELPSFLEKDTLLVFNNTKVIHARLFFQKSTGSTIEIFCLEPWESSISESFEQRESSTWMCFIGNNKKWKEGPLSRELEIDGKKIVIEARRLHAISNAWVVEFTWTGGFSFAEIIEHAGVIPLPPYLHREAVDSDNQRYQTVYAEHQGSVAAPTAGLHFTENVFSKLKTMGISTEFITLHVGAGTFKPVSCERIGEHEMHVEKIQITKDNLTNIIHHHPKPLIAVGTTSVRTLESLYWFGVKLEIYPNIEEMNILQWDPYELEKDSVSLTKSFSNIVEWMEKNDIDHMEGNTQLMIAPGYKYHVINGIVTNFHQPKSTLLLLVSALIGDSWKKCYQYALDHDFRFLSYGDSCLFIP